VPTTRRPSGITGSSKVETTSAAEILRRVLPFERQCLFTTDPMSGMPTDVVAEGLREEEMRFFLEKTSCSRMT
jgi:hypothetical protein